MGDAALGLAEKITEQSVEQALTDFKAEILKGRLRRARNCRASSFSPGHCPTASAHGDAASINEDTTDASSGGGTPTNCRSSNTGSNTSSSIEMMLADMSQKIAVQLQAVEAAL